jgi:cold shock CspA family protein
VNAKLKFDNDSPNTMKEEKMSGKDLFVHHSEIQADGFATLNDGQEVEYEIGEGQKGPCANSVKAI